MGALPPHHRIGKDRLVPFLAALRREGFGGETLDDQAARIVHATDNSIYQLAPALIAFPKNGEDVARLMRAAAETGMPVTPRGGGTGTNGQSLSGGVVVDFSRHMNRILGLDAERREVTVEPGVVLDQLNAWLKPHGLFFPPTVSTASRATIGGMVATDASGKGSRLYGRTSAYVEALDVVLADGSSACVRSVDAAGIEQTAKSGSHYGKALLQLRETCLGKQREIRSVFPAMNRGLTGYNLLDVLGADGLYHPQKLLAGSEGTLAVTRAITLRLIERPAARAIAVIRYRSFSAALDDVSRLLEADPAAIEIMDDKVLALAREDVVWQSLEAVLGGPTEVPVGGLNVVEFVGASDADIMAGLARLDALSDKAGQGQLDAVIVREPALVATVWELRKKAVGLLGRLGGIPFIEDTAVPPQSLPAYLKEFRTILDAHGLDYGMFGHADVGCLHVRPVLDMRNPAHAALIRPLSDQVADLTRRYGGLIWGEHGRGFRGEYSPQFFGEALYAELRAIKAAFDPDNLLNPGKLAAPNGQKAIDRIDAIPLRGDFDRQISGPLKTGVEKAVACNGNGACFGWDAADLMCPSYKATRDRSQSPKGRAALLREWARRKSAGEDHLPDFRPFEDAVHAALATCLSCKACSSLCPVRVDIPAMRATFMEDYYRHRRRPLRHHLMARMEEVVLFARRLPDLFNRLSGFRLSRLVLDRLFGLVDLPVFHPARVSKSGGQGAAGPLVVLLEDPLNAAFDGRVIDAAETLLDILGYRVTRIGPLQNGKALQVLGHGAAFARIAHQAFDRLAREAPPDASVITLDAATGLLFEDDFVKATGRSAPVKVEAIEAFLDREIREGRIAAQGVARPAKPLSLLPHCTEKSARPQVGKLWTSVFSHFGLSLAAPPVGCCGMAGMFGHETEHKALSQSLFEMSWRPIVDRNGVEAVLASGFSCRCQTERMTGSRPRHPVEALLQCVLADGSPSGSGASNETNKGKTDAE